MEKLLISEVELNQHLLRSGDILFYIDDSWSDKYEIIEVHDSGVTLRDGDGSEDFYFFSEFQYGWSISDKSKEYNRINFRTQYLQ